MRSDSIKVLPGARLLGRGRGFGAARRAAQEHSRRGFRGCRCSWLRLLQEFPGEPLGVH
jgi:hypothetical protein